MPPVCGLQNAQPRVVLNDIFKDVNDINRRMNIIATAARGLDKKIPRASPRATNRAKRSHEADNASQSSVLLVPKTENETEEVVVPKKRKGRPPKFIIDKEIVVNAILKRRNEILTSRKRLVTIKNPAWIKIKQELDNKIPVASIYSTAKTKKVYQLLRSDKSDSSEDRKEDIPNVSNVEAVVQEPAAPPTISPLSRRDNTGEVFERALVQLVTSIDFLTKQIVELRNAIRGKTDDDETA